MKNESSKILLALNIIKKFNKNIHVQRTESEDLVYLFDYSMSKKTIGSLPIKFAVSYAQKQQDWPKMVNYKDGILSIETNVNVENVDLSNKAEFLTDFEVIEVVDIAKDLDAEVIVKKTRKKRK